MKQYRIPKELGEKWTSALESGDFMQTTGVLKRDNKYCCLGVLGCILNADQSLLEDNHSLVIEDFIDGLPEELHCRNNFTNNDIIFILSHLNDNYHGFIDISNWIKENCEFI